MNVIQNSLVNLLLHHLANNPMEKLPTMINIADKLDKGHRHKDLIEGVRTQITDKDNQWYGFVEDALTGLDPKLMQKMVECFVINATLAPGEKCQKIRNENDCNVPWAILMDPTSACNLHCTGCWAAHYGDRNNLSLETLDSICKQGKELGIYFYILSGGEPLVRKADLLKLCEMNQDCFFLAFSNGTLVDDQFCEDIRKQGNFAIAFSIEGDEAATDMRRGAGTYQKVIQAMARMKEHHLLFGYSTCYHRYNTEQIGSDEFVDDMIARGCRFAWNFTYMPVGKDAPTDLLATAEQREYMYHRIREIRETKPIFALDFWNDGEYVGGCIAGGRNYLHINAAGDVEPCAFIHYSNANIHEVSLLDALKSPIFKAYKENQPFNQNHLRPCPLLDNPGALANMVKQSGAKSTDMEAPEDVDDLSAKTKTTADIWAVRAGELWEERNEKIAEEKAKKEASLEPAKS